MKQLLVGVVVGVLVLCGLVLVFAGGVGRTELLLFLAVAVASGVLAARAVKSSATRPPLR